MERIVDKVIRAAVADAFHAVPAVGNVHYSASVKDKHIEPVLKRLWSGDVNNTVVFDNKKQAVRQYMTSAGLIVQATGGASSLLTSKAFDLTTARWWDRHQFWAGVILASLLTLLAGIIQAYVTEYWIGTPSQFGERHDSE